MSLARRIFIQEHLPFTFLFRPPKKEGKHTPDGCFLCACKSNVASALLGWGHKRELWFHIFSSTVSKKKKNCIKFTLVFTSDQFGRLHSAVNKIERRRYFLIALCLVYRLNLYFFCSRYFLSNVNMLN